MHRRPKEIMTELVDTLMTLEAIQAKRMALEYELLQGGTAWVLVTYRDATSVVVIPAEGTSTFLGLQFTNKGAGRVEWMRTQRPGSDTRGNYRVLLPKKPVRVDGEILMTLYGDLEADFPLVEETDY